MGIPVEDNQKVKEKDDEPCYVGVTTLNVTGATMEQYSGTMLHLQSLRVKGNLADRTETTNDGRSLVVQTIVGDLVEEPPVCGGCGRSMHVSDTRSRTLKHLGLSFARIDVEVHYKVYRCPVCGRIRRNAIPFKAKGHNMTWLFFKDIADALERDRSTISNIAVGVR